MGLLWGLLSPGPVADGGGGVGSARGSWCVPAEVALAGVGGWGETGDGWARDTHRPLPATWLLGVWWGAFACRAQHRPLREVWVWPVESGGPRKGGLWAEPSYEA